MAKRFEKKKLHTLVELQFNKKTGEYDLVRDEWEWYEGPWALAHNFPSTDQLEYRWKDDVGGETDTTWLELVNTSHDVDVSSGNVQLRVRFVMQEGGGATETNPPTTLQFQINGGGYTSIGAATTGAIYYDSGNLTDGESTTDQLGGTGSFIAGEVGENGAVSAINIAANDHIEHEFTVELVAADLSDNDSLDFRMTPADSYTATANLTITKAAGTQTITDTDFISSGSTTYTPTVKGSIALVAGFIAATSALFTPDVNAGIYTITDTDFISSTSVTYEPSVSVGAGSQTINDTDYISATSVTYEPDVVDRIFDDFSGDLSRWSEEIGSGFSISSGQLRRATTEDGFGISSIIYNAYKVGDDEHWAKVTVGPLENTKFYGIALRVSSLGSIDCYWVLADPDQTIINYIVNGAYGGEILNDTTTLTWTTNDVLAASVEGIGTNTRFKIWKNPVGDSPTDWGTPDITKQISNPGHAQANSGDYVGITNISMLAHTGTPYLDDFSGGSFPAGQTISSTPYISATSVTYEPTVSIGDAGQTITDTDYISATSVTYEPTFTGTLTIPDVNYITSGNTLYEPTLVVGEYTITDTDYISSTSVTYEPTVISSYTITDVDYISATSVTYEPTLVVGEYTITDTDYISATSITYEPTVSLDDVQIITDTDFISATSVTYEPTFTGSYTITDTDFISAGSILYEPTFIGSLTITDVGFISSGSATYEPVIGLKPTEASHTINSPRQEGQIESGPTCFVTFLNSTSVDNVGDIPDGLSFVQVTATIATLQGTFSYNSAGTYTIQFSATNSFGTTLSAEYELVVKDVLQADFISSTTTLYEPDVTALVENQIDPSFIASTATLYLPEAINFIADDFSGDHGLNKWTEHTGSGFSISSGVLKPATSESSQTSLLTYTAYTPDTNEQWAKVTVGPPFTTSYYGITLRVSESPITGYWPNINNSTLTISRILNGVWDATGDLESWGGITWIEGDVLAASVQGTGTDTKFNIWQNPVGDNPNEWGAPDWTFTIDNIAHAVADTGDYVGIGNYNAAVQPATFYEDDFVGGSFFPEQSITDVDFISATSVTYEPDMGIAPFVTTSFITDRIEGEESFWYQNYISFQLNGETPVYEDLSAELPDGISFAEELFVVGMVSYVGVLGPNSSGTYYLQAKVTTQFGTATSGLNEWVITDAVDVDFIGPTSVTYEPVLGGAGITLVDFIASGNVLYEPTVSVGAVILSIDYIASGSALYEPTLTGSITITDVDFITSTLALYEPIVYDGSVVQNYEIVDFEVKISRSISDEYNVSKTVSDTYKITKEVT